MIRSSTGAISSTTSSQVQSHITAAMKITGVVASTSGSLTFAIGVVRFAIDIVRSSGLVYSNPRIKSSVVGASSLISITSNSALPLSNKERKRAVYQAIIVSCKAKKQGVATNA